MHKFFIGLFTILTVYAGFSAYSTQPVSRGDSINNLAHGAALNRVTQAAARSGSIRLGSAGYSTGGFSHGGYSQGGYSGGSYRGGK